MRGSNSAHTFLRFKSNALDLFAIFVQRLQERRMKETKIVTVVLDFAFLFQFINLVFSTMPLSVHFPSEIN